MNSPASIKQFEHVKSVDDLAAAILDVAASGRRAATSEVPKSISAAANAIAQAFGRANCDYWYMLVARHIGGQTLEEIAQELQVTRQRVSQLLQRETDRVFVGFEGERLWENANWMHALAADAELPHRQMAIPIFRTLISIANSNKSENSTTQWSKFIENGIFPSDFFLQGSLKAMPGYKAPAWVTEVLHGSGVTVSIYFWQPSIWGPAIASSGGVQDARVETFGALAWADAVAFDFHGPVAAVVFLRDELDEINLSARLEAAVLIGSAMPIPVLLVLPRARHVAETRWATLDLEGFPVPSERAPFRTQVSEETLSCVKPYSPLQQIWHLHESALPTAIIKICQGATPEEGHVPGIWGKYVIHCPSGSGLVLQPK